MFISNRVLRIRSGSCDRRGIFIFQNEIFRAHKELYAIEICAQFYSDGRSKVTEHSNTK